MTIGAGVTVKMSGRILTAPVYWLATGAVQIDGTLDLNGDNGRVKWRIASDGWFDERSSLPH